MTAGHVRIGGGCRRCFSGGSLLFGIGRVGVLCGDGLHLRFQPFALSPCLCGLTGVPVDVLTRWLISATLLCHRHPLLRADTDSGYIIARNLQRGYSAYSQILPLEVSRTTTPLLVS